MSTKTEKTLLLTRDDVARLLTLPELIEALREAYRLRANHELIIRPQRAVARYGEESTTVTFPGVLPDCERYTVKVNAKTAGNVARGLPFLRGVILLINRTDGANEAILESGLLTAMRTGAAGALAADLLAPKEARTVMIIGAGLQAEWMLPALAHVRKIREVRVFDVVRERADDWMHRMSSKVPALYKIAESPREARETDIVVTVTQSREPILLGEDFRPGQCILAMGSDEPGKVELATDLLQRCRLVSDDRDLCFSDGAFNVAFRDGAITAEHIHAELGEILAGQRTGRTAGDESFVFGNVGLPFQDLVAAQIVRKRALAEGVGMLFTW
jgi:ornithine cyclodeaminase/alanine dehydrogenase-like protein (mu-crystallin family)